MYQNLHNLISNYVNISEKEKQLLSSAFSYREVPKKFVLTRQGDVARDVFFINKGLLRLYYNRDGKDVTAFIFREKLFAASYESFLKKEPSVQNLETLEDCELLSISFDRLEQLTEEMPKMHILLRKVAEHRFINAQKILTSFLFDSPEDRYRHFEAENRDLLLRVPHHMIASYLGISPVSMSRIRKRLLKG